MYKRKIGAMLFITSIFLLIISLKATITGNVIFNSFESSSYNYFLVLAILFISLIFLTSKRNLDAILIAGKSTEKLNRQRARKVVRMYNNKELNENILIVASGGKTQGLNKKYTSEAHMMYEELRKGGIKPKNIGIENLSQDTIENIRYSFTKFLKNKKNIGVVANPLQIDRIKYIINKAKKENLINQGVKIYGLKTHEKKERAYEFISKYLTMFALRNGVKNAKLPGGNIKKVVNNLMEKISK
jgi:uncharacterized SAM-binding protein YcdF (DUF218 family)